MMDQKISEYIQRPRAPFQRGVSDCCAWVAGWAEFVSGSFPGEELNEPWTDREALRILRTHGGMAGLMGMVLVRDGWVSIDTPQDGDIVVIESVTALNRETTGIWNRGNVVSLTEDACIFVTKNPTVKGAWRWT